MVSFSFGKVGPKATPGKLQCLCTHLSAFGGDLFVAPNPIDFDKVMSEFGNLAASGNFVVLAFVCVIFGLYATGLIIARRADKIDKFEVAVFSIVVSLSMSSEKGKPSITS